MCQNVSGVATETLAQGTNNAKKWGKHLYEAFHVTSGVKQWGVSSPYLFAVNLYDLSNELNNIKAGCHIGKILLNHLIAC